MGLEVTPEKPSQVSKHPDEPSVWKEQNVTIVFNQQRATVYIGSNKVGYVKALALKIDVSDQAPKLELTFPAINAIAVEENIRLVRTIPWITTIIE